MPLEKVWIPPSQFYQTRGRRLCDRFRQSKCKNCSHIWKISLNVCFFLRWTLVSTRQKYSHSTSIETWVTKWHYNEKYLNRGSKLIQSEMLHSEMIQQTAKSLATSCIQAGEILQRNVKRGYQQNVDLVVSSIMYVFAHSRNTWVRNVTGENNEDSCDSQKAKTFNTQNNTPLLLISVQNTCKKVTPHTHTHTHTHTHVNFIFATFKVYFESHRKYITV